MDVSKPAELLRPLNIRTSSLMGAGPTNSPARVLQALNLPICGNYNPETYKLLDDIKLGLQYVLQTKSPLTLAISASGHGGMEAAISNLLEPGDKILILDTGFWSERASIMASRYGGDVVRVASTPGTNFSLEAIEKAVVLHGPALLYVTHGESSSGVYQPIEGIAPICHRYNCLLIVDAVASLGGVALFTDRWDIDCVFSCSQKALGALPGLAPITFSQRAQVKMEKRKTAPATYFFDVKLHGQYWGCYPGLTRTYHHTVSTPLLCALREALAMIVEEGLQQFIGRHKTAAQLLYQGVTQLGLDLFVEDPAARLPTVTTVLIPSQVNTSKMISTALDEGFATVLNTVTHGCQHMIDKWHNKVAQTFPPPSEIM